jgi:putative transposase
VWLTAGCRLARADIPASRHTLELWRLDYNTQRPHTSLDGLTPVTFANRSAMEHNPDGLWL